MNMYNIKQQLKMRKGWKCGNCGGIVDSYYIE